MDNARVRDHASGQYLFNGNVVPFVRLPVANDRLAAPAIGTLAVLGVVHLWGAGGQPVAEVHVTVLPQPFSATGGEHSDPQ
jgi:hypothetical protein